MTPDELARRARRTRVLVLVHVALALVILAAFVWAQSHR